MMLIVLILIMCNCLFLFFFNDTATTEIYTLSLHDALPILFRRLRKLRKAIADEEEVPPYVVFNDNSLVEMAMYCPIDEAAFLEITGVGQKKLERYGKEFIAAITAYLDGENEPLLNF